MKKIFLLISLILPFLCNFAQEVVVRETFDAKNEAWESSGDSTAAEFKDGCLILSGHSSQSKVNVLRNVIIDPSGDFSITCRIKYNRGAGENPFGFVLVDNRFTKNPLWYYLMLYQSDSFRISLTKGADMEFNEYLPKLKTNGTIRSAGEYNDLELKNTGGVFGFFINGQKVWTKEYPDICISRVGFFSQGDQEVQADDLVIYQNGWHQIHQIDDTIKVNLKENLGSNVNSANSELSPIISADGQTLYLCVQGDTNNIGPNHAQDIWYSTLNADNTWSLRQNIGFPLNNEAANSVNYVSPDNNSLLLINRYDESGKAIGGGFSVSNRQKSGWSMPVSLEIDNLYNLNKYINIAFSPTGKTLIMALEREDTFGDLDLYISMKKEDGTWWEPRNIGPDINTFGCEFAPFLAADNATLYFVTNARPGYGAADIFMTRRLDDTWMSWSEPENLGPGINTPGWDAYFSIPASGEYCYLVSSSNSLGNTDIFRVKVSKAARPNPVALVKGRVLRVKSSESVEATITYYDLETNKEIGTARANPIDGTYQISLPAGHKYSYYAQRVGYYPESQNIDLMSMDAYAEIIENLFLAPIECGQNIRLNNIFFEFDKSELLQPSIYEMDRLVKVLLDNPNMVIQIAGYTDNRGTDSYNNTLSLDRANAVHRYLNSKNVGNRVSSAGFGNTKPVASNETDEGRALNRRVEFKITCK